MMRLSPKIKKDNLLPQVVLMPSLTGTLLIGLVSIQRVFPVNPFGGLGLLGIGGSDGARTPSDKITVLPPDDTASPE